jgi:pimeloyl-ACP methyl ester carboxylesterase
MKQINVKGLETAYYEGGIGEQPVLFVHGWAASGRMWLRSMWSMRHSARMWALDLPGFGDSDTPGQSWDQVDYYTDHVAAFCEALGIRPKAVVGHSMGGRVALDFARRYPDSVERLITVSPTVTGKLGFNANLFMGGGLGRLVHQASRHFWPLATAGALSSYWTPNFLGSEGVKRTADDLRRSSWQNAFGSLLAISNVDFSPHLPEISHPTLVVCGGRDYTIPTQDSLLTAESLPDARLVVMDRVHHWPSDENLEGFIQTIEPFIAGG